MHKCKYCNKEFETGLQVGGHTVWCKHNPNREKSAKSLSAKSSGTKNSASRSDVKQKIANTIRNNVKNGNWHLSFSKSRTFKYKEISFHGLWEIEYAKWLDQNLIKWRRPTEKFEYEFEGKHRFYTPDFYLIDDKKYVEIKGYPTDKDFAKWQQFPLDLEIINGFDLFSIGIISMYRKVDRQYMGKSWNL